ncbi:MAG: nucleoside deaminase [Bacilli bacterium]|nr:nucleoside deaminase [Bacilli bacterium]
MEDKYFDILLKLALKAFKKNEVPVSALIVQNGRILARTYNTRQKCKKIWHHAEILAIEKASKKIKSWHLDDCDLYVTLKPCLMCESIIKQSHIRNVYYILDKSNEKREYNKTKIVKANKSMYESAYSQYLRDFFQNKRDKK